jgi:phosphoenolpyruvate-protein phosphotransferase (PTS system enzyme I)
MFTLQGKGACKGITIGEAYFYKRVSQVVTRTHSTPSKELKRFECAKIKAIEELANLYEKALGEVGEQGAALFEIHQMMLEDEDYCDSIVNIINRQSVNAEFAVAQTSDSFSQMFSQMEDEYMKAREADVRDVSDRLISALCGNAKNGINSQYPVILMSDDLAPSETVQFDKSKILAFVTSSGSTNSHTAILSRTMGIPAVVGVGGEICDDLNGKTVIVDGIKGVIIIEPDNVTLSEYESKIKEEKQTKELLQQQKGKRSTTKDGTNIKIYANIGTTNDLGLVLHNDAEGIGLFRSEFLYLESSDYPTEESLFSAYKNVVQTMAGKPVIIRTLDIGADKQVDYFNFPKEENPALGMRAIRLCLTRLDIFKTQLRALYRASVFGTLYIMFPMIISLDEILKIKILVEEIKTELKNDSIPYDDNVLLGIMIETPAAAIISDVLAQHVDFFSIGTNDLTQYTLAIDRQNLELEQFLDIHHEAVLRLIKMTCDNAHKYGKWVGICGELGADLTLTEQFLRMGVDELSVSPPLILSLRKAVREISLK